MEMNDLFDFELNEAEGYWSVTGYYGKGEDVVFPASYEGKLVKAIGNEFSPYNKRIKRITIPEGYTSIGALAFQKCTGLTEINFPESLTAIGDLAFGECKKLTNIELPKNLTSIGSGAFLNCVKLTSVKLQDSLTSIRELAFNGCTGLTNIKLPKSLTSIGGIVFEGCTELTEITVDKNNSVFCSVDGVLFDKTMVTLIWFPEGKEGRYSVPEGIAAIEYKVFNNCKLTGLSFPESLQIIDNFGFYGDQFYGNQLTEITVNELNPVFCSIDGVLFDKRKHRLMAYPSNKDKTNYSVPDGTLRIDKHAFVNCKRLINIVLPESVESIGDGAFEHCEGLKTVTLPMNLKYLGEGVFEDCPNIETVTLSRKTIIADKAFVGFKGRLVYRD